MRYKPITEEQRQRVKKNSERGIGEKVNATMVGISERSVQRILGTYESNPDRHRVQATITNEIEEYKAGDEFWIGRIRSELYYGNMPPGLTMEFSDGHTAEMKGAQLVRDDGMRMMLNGIAKHRWG